MDQIVLRGMARWPNTPAVYGWLRLDARGSWRLRNPATGAFELIGNEALREYIGRNYSTDEHGRWFFQNGPQRVFVDLECAPLVFRLVNGHLWDHCGRPVERLMGVWLDERATLYALGARGAGSLDDRDLLAISEGFVDTSGAPMAPDAILDAVGDPGVGLAWRSEYGDLSLQRVASADAPRLFGYIRTPQPDPDDPRVLSP